jgi:hypothetical protein
LWDDVAAAKTNFKTEVYAGPQRTLHLPFVDEEMVVSWEHQVSMDAPVDDDGNKFTDALGREQVFFTLFIKICKLKAKRKQLRLLNSCCCCSCWWCCCFKCNSSQSIRNL